MPVETESRSSAQFSSDFGTIDRFREVDADSGEAFTVVKAMCIQSLNAGIEMQSGTAIFGSERFEPSQQGRSMAVRSGFLVCHEIVHVQKASPGQIFENSETGGRDDFSID